MMNIEQKKIEKRAEALKVARQDDEFQRRREKKKYIKNVLIAEINTKVILMSWNQIMNQK